MEFWQYWEKCKYLFDEMQNALIKAKESNPSVDYTKHDEKLRIMSDLQGYIGKLHERVTVIKDINLQHGERYFQIKMRYIAEVQKNKKLEDEIKNLKINMS